MRKERFKHRGIAKTLTMLCEVSGPPLWNDKRTEPRQAEIKRQSGVDQGLLSRVLRGETSTMTDDNVRKLAKLFKVTPSQMRGESPIERIDGANADAADKEFIARYLSHPEDLKRALRAFEAAWMKPDQTNER